MELKIGDLVYYGMKRFGIITKIMETSVQVLYSDGQVWQEDKYIAEIMKARIQECKRE